MTELWLSAFPSLCDAALNKVNLYHFRVRAVIFLKQEFAFCILVWFMFGVN